MSSVLNLIALGKFLSYLNKDWKSFDAYKAGVIDASGRLLVTSRTMTRQQKRTYGAFERIMFNLKRLLEKVPGGSSQIGRIATSLYLLRDHLGDSFRSAEEHILEQVQQNSRDLIVEEKEMGISTGTYLLETGQEFILYNDLQPIDTCLKQPIYKFGPAYFTSDMIQEK